MLRHTLNNQVDGMRELLGQNNVLRNHDTYLLIATQVAMQSTCLRRKHGALVVNKNGIISTGTNRVAPGEVSCIASGQCWRSENNIPHGERYEACLSVHAEQEALIKMDYSKVDDETYLVLVGYDCNTGEFIPAVPCYICRKMLVTAGVDRMIGFKFENGIRVMNENSIPVIEERILPDLT